MGLLDEYSLISYWMQNINFMVEKRYLFTSNVIKYMKYRTLITFDQNLYFTPFY